MIQFNYTSWVMWACWHDLLELNEITVFLFWGIIQVTFYIIYYEGIIIYSTVIIFTQTCAWPLNLISVESCSSTLCTLDTYMLASAWDIFALEQHHRQATAHFGLVITAWICIPTNCWTPVFNTPLVSHSKIWLKNATQFRKYYLAFFAHF